MQVGGLREVLAKRILIEGPTLFRITASRCPQLRGIGLKGSILYAILHCYGLKNRA